MPQIPPFHSGGIYRAPSAGGEGMAWLRDGEGVFTPDQMAALGGSGTGGDLIINGSTITPSAIIVAQRRWNKRNGRSTS